MSTGRLSRRRLVAAAIVFSAAAATPLGGSLMQLSRAWAEAGTSVDAEVLATMLRMARLLYPHDALPDAVYAEVLDQALSAAATGSDFAGQLDGAAAALDRLTGGDWLEADPEAQLKAIEAISGEPYFAAIQGQVLAGVYNSAAFWQLVGYPGPSKDFGGYLHRGAGEIDWLPGESG